MDIKELRKKEIKDLHKLLAAKREKFRELKFSASNKQLKNVRELRVAKNDIAQILTIIKELIKN